MGGEEVGHLATYTEQDLLRTHSSREGLVSQPQLLCTHGLCQQIVIGDPARHHGNRGALVREIDHKQIFKSDNLM